MLMKQREQLSCRAVASEGRSARRKPGQILTLLLLLCFVLAACDLSGDPATATPVPAAATAVPATVAPSATAAVLVPVTLAAPSATPADGSPATASPDGRSPGTATPAPGLTIQPP